LAVPPGDKKKNPGTLIEDFDRRGIRTKQRRGINGQVMGGIRFGVFVLAYLLKNRLYIGEVMYRGELHRAEHEPILDRDLFAAVQAKLAASAVARQLWLKGPPPARLPDIKKLVLEGVRKHLASMGQTEHPTIDDS
jgi:hypothetical protein